VYNSTISIQMPCVPRRQSQEDGPLRSLCYQRTRSLPQVAALDEEVRARVNGQADTQPNATCEQSDK
jgi:hypothetical protein